MESRAVHAGALLAGAMAFAVWLLVWYDATHANHTALPVASRTVLGYLCGEVVVLAGAFLTLVRYQARVRLAHAGAQPSGPPSPVASRGGRWSEVLLPLAIAIIVAAGMLIAPVAASAVWPAAQTCACPPYELGMEVLVPSSPRAGLYDLELGLAPTPGLTTAMFGLELMNASTAATLPLGAAPGSCASPSGGTRSAFNSTNCGPSASGWYAVLVEPGGWIGSVFQAPAAWSSAPLPLTNAMHLYLASATNLSATEDVLDAAGTLSYSVSGAAWL
jgi:hypothetical protein